MLSSQIMMYYNIILWTYNNLSEKFDYKCNKFEKCLINPTFALFKMFQKPKMFCLFSGLNLILILTPRLSIWSPTVGPHNIDNLSTHIIMSCIATICTICISVPHSSPHQKTLGFAGGAEQQHRHVWWKEDLLDDHRYTTHNNDMHKHGAILSSGQIKYILHSL